MLYVHAAATSPALGRTKRGQRARTKRGTKKGGRGEIDKSTRAITPDRTYI